MPQYEHVVIVGVGLLGGSIGMALRSRGIAQRVTGVGRNSASLDAALKHTAVDDVSTNLATACRSADLAIICTPVQSVVANARECLSNMRRGLVTDVGSTKATICAQLSAAPTAGATFVGSHPLAGSDKSGVQFATADLFQDRLCVVTPQPDAADSDTEATKQTEDLWQSLGAQTRRMTPQMHDQAIAATSHVPHIVASAIAATTPDAVLPLTASGWCDTTRIAAGSTELWQQIISENLAPVTKSLKSFSCEIQTWITALEAGDANRIQQLLDAGKQKRDSVGN